jgi:F-type H+-transporting ATPase subunit delta
MQNPRLAERYAISLMDIASEQGKLDAIYNDMLGIHQMCKDSKDFILLMRSPVVKADKKNEIVQALLDGKVDSLAMAFLRLIINKGREFFLPEIATAFVAQYKKKNNITEVTLTTAEVLDEAMLGTLKEKVLQQLKGNTIDLTTKVDAELIGGFVLEANNNLFDASILRDLNDIKKQFLKNEYIQEIR